MNSPALYILNNFIRIDRSDSTAIYLQIAQGIIQAIHTKSLQSGAKLPGTRLLSEYLYLHRNTVTAAYEEIAAQGWIEIIPQKGAFVSKKIKQTSLAHTENNCNPSVAPFKVEKNIVLDLPHSNIVSDFYFTAGTTDHRTTPLKEVQQLFASIIQRKTTQKQLNKSFPVENGNLKNQLMNHLHISKGFSMATPQLLICNSNESSIQSIIQTILKPGDKVLIIEPGNYAMHMRLKQAQIDIISLSLKNSQLDFIALDKILKESSIRAIYIQTNQLYPAIHLWTLVQKQKLLDFAFENNCILIEDDNASDYIYTQIIPSSFKKMDKQGVVIYFNSLQDLLPAPFNIGYIIAADNVITELEKTKNSLQNPCNYLVEETLAEYIKEGLLFRQIQKNTKLYRKRRDHFQQLLEHNFENNIQIETPVHGLAFWITFNAKLPLLSIAKHCESNNLYIPSYLLYQNQNITGMRISFGHLNETEADKTISILSKAVYNYLYPEIN